MGSTHIDFTKKDTCVCVWRGGTHIDFTEKGTCVCVCGGGGGRGVKINMMHLLPLKMFPFIKFCQKFMVELICHSKFFIAS